MNIKKLINLIRDNFLESEKCDYCNELMAECQCDQDQECNCSTNPQENCDD